MAEHRRRCPFAPDQRRRHGAQDAPGAMPGDQHFDCGGCQIFFCVHICVHYYTKASRPKARRLLCLGSNGRARTEGRSCPGVRRPMAQRGVGRIPDQRPGSGGVSPLKRATVRPERPRHTGGWRLHILSYCASSGLGCWNARNIHRFRRSPSMDNCTRQTSDRLWPRCNKNAGARRRIWMTYRTRRRQVTPAGRNECSPHARAAKINFG